MTTQEKLSMIEEIVRPYQGKETIFEQPTEETERQRQFREDLHAVVSVVFASGPEMSATMSVADLRSRLQQIWQKTKPESWKD